MTNVETEQGRKHRIGLAGEFLATGELLRRGLQAAVTYGNAKKADVVAVRNGRAVSIEVKTTMKEKWVIGSRVPDPSDQVWILVYLPESNAPPEYFIVTSRDLHELMIAKQSAYYERFRAEHGEDFGDRKGVCSVKRTQVESFANAWGKVDDLLIGS